MEQKKNVVMVVLDAEDIHRLEAIVGWDGTKIRLEKGGDIEILKENGQNAGHACGDTERNHKLKEILLTPVEQDVRLLIWDKSKEDFTEVKIKVPQNGVLDLKLLLKN